ncbi:MAG TPA: VWA domain-containing protein [Alphaproteobacteria bacterium]|nr:VWA domain-containing protein [Alphaproteobacteria bacterium]
MTERTMKSFVLTVSLACFCVAGLGQTPSPASPQQPSATPAPAVAGDDLANAKVLRVLVDEVSLIFTVQDKHGKFVKDLPENEFRVLDNGRPPKQVRRFEAQTNLPLRVGLLIDASTSIRERFLFEQQAAVEFLQQIIRPETDKAFVMEFDDEFKVTQDFTNDLDKLTKGVKVIRPGGGTAMWDAVYSACRDKLLKQKEGVEVRNAIILVSDGDDNQSRALREEAVEMAQRANVIIYAISTSLTNIHDNGAHNLKLLAEATGGRAFFPFKLSELSDAFSAIQGELRSQYSLFYKPEGLIANGQFRPIEVNSASKKYKIRAKKGYYAPK